jgi:YHS domain-containing protein
MAIDPVNGVEVDEKAASETTGHTWHGANEVDPTKGTRYFYDGTWYFFSSVGNRLKFIADPAAYIGKDAPAKPAGQT